MDTGCTAAGLVWRTDLIESGLNPDQHIVEIAPLRTTVGTMVSDRARKVDLWLFSNRSMLASKPFLIRAASGLHVASTLRPQLTHFPIIGQAALLQVGIKIDLDYHRRTVSVWVPASPIQTLVSAFGRFARFRSPTPIRWQGG
jgi:hypothetical protein